MKCKQTRKRRNTLLWQRIDGVEKLLKNGAGATLRNVKQLNQQHERR